MESINDDDRVDETMDNDDDAVDLASLSNIVPLLDLDELRRLLEELASTRPDVQTPSTRNARIRLTTEALRRQDDSSGRQLLAGMRKGATAALLSY